MRPSGTHLYKRVCPSVRRSVRRSVRPSVRPSVGPSVRPSRLCKKRVSRLFLATVRSYTETNDQPTCFESVFARLFVHLSLHTYVAWSIHAETQPGRIVAQSGLLLSSVNHRLRLRLKMLKSVRYVFLIYDTMGKKLSKNFKKHYNDNSILLVDYKGLNMSRDISRSSTFLRRFLNRRLQCHAPHYSAIYLSLRLLSSGRMNSCLLLLFFHSLFSSFQFDLFNFREWGGNKFCSRRHNSHATGERTKEEYNTVIKWVYLQRREKNQPFCIDPLGLHVARLWQIKI